LAPVSDQQPGVRVGEAVADALSEGRPVVALESTIFSNLGLPAPANGEALERCVAAIEAEGAVPALTAVLDGVAWVGVAGAQRERVLGAARKCAARELPVAMAQGWPVGATTVSASLALAAAAGIAVFATGGIGGVHRGVELSADVSHDLYALAEYPVLCVSAGAKAFLDLPRTLEVLETLGVPVLGYQTGEFPAFWVRASGLAVPAQVHDPVEAAAVYLAARRLGQRGGTLVVAPVPAADALDAAAVLEAIDTAQADADAGGVRGGAVTPFILERIASLTGAASIPANLALAENNAAIAARIAAAITAARA
jgi:pseudouridine-5'-phosphate glycosidase